MLDCAEILCPSRTMITESRDAYKHIQSTVKVKFDSDISPEVSAVSIRNERGLPKRQFRHESSESVDRVVLGSFVLSRCIVTALEICPPNIINFHIYWKIPNIIGYSFRNRTPVQSPVAPTRLRYLAESSRRYRGRRQSVPTRDGTGHTLSDTHDAGCPSPVPRRRGRSSQLSRNSPGPPSR